MTNTQVAYQQLNVLNTYEDILPTNTGVFSHSLAMYEAHFVINTFPLVSPVDNRELVDSLLCLTQV